MSKKPKKSVVVTASKILLFLLLIKDNFPTFVAPYHKILPTVLRKPILVSSRFAETCDNSKTATK